MASLRKQDLFRAVSRTNTHKFGLAGASIPCVFFIHGINCYGPKSSLISANKSFNIMYEQILDTNQNGSTLRQTTLGFGGIKYE